MIIASARSNLLAALNEGELIIGYSEYLRATSCFIEQEIVQELLAGVFILSWCCCCVCAAFIKLECIIFWEVAIIKNVCIICCVN